MIAIIVCAVIGFFFLGPLGAVIGAILGLGIAGKK